ncbi:MAG TPA: trypsin-like peptidase domain-containing protein, partial [Longimicrobiales bacterium]
MLPAVVYIQVESHAAPAPPPGSTQAPLGPGGAGQDPGAQGPGGTGPGEPLPQLPPGTMSRGAGSGVLFRSDGYILTSDHVVRDADIVSVTLHDHRQYEARVVAEDPSTDVAVVRIDARNLPAARLGDSDVLQPGDWVLALGAPLGLQFSVTAGIVSALGRSIGILQQNATASMHTAPLEHFIQTDAPINPGNSGGPLVDLSGRVIGINTAIATPTGVFAGAGFAVPINLARRMAEELIRYGEVRRAFLGVVLNDATEADARVFHLRAAEGAMLTHVDPQGPAALAGMQMGDVVIRIDSVKVQTTSDLQNALAEIDPGKEVQITVVRYGERLTIPVKLGLVRTGTVPRPTTPDNSDTIGIGFAVAPVGGHMVISAVRPYSAADRAGLRAGQVIDSVNKHPISSLDDLARAIGTADGVLSLVLQDPQ